VTIGDTHSFGVTIAKCVAVGISKHTVYGFMYHVPG
jgi:hypothetical protein